MPHIRGLLSTAQALRQAFIAPLRTTRPGLFHSTPIIQNAPQLRFLQFRRPAPSDSASAVSGPIKDEAINAPTVQIVNEAGSLDPPIQLNAALRSFDRSKYFLLQVSPSGDNNRPPVCKLLNKIEVQENEKAKAKAVKAAKVNLKQVELNWAIDAHDLSHRLKQLTTFLEKGRKVEIVLTRKRKKRAPTVEEVKQVMQSVLDTVRDAGATQIKAMEGKPGEHVILVVKKET